MKTAFKTFYWSLISFLSLFISATVYPQLPSNEFIDALISGNENIRDFVDESELIRSERLGINYNDIKNKFLISYDIDENVKSGIKEGKFTYKTEEKNLENGFSGIKFTVPSMNYIKHFYFYAGKFVSPTKYITKAWRTIESKYFIFKISNPMYYNDYCIDKLDNFVDSICTLLEVRIDRRKLLQKEKIYYIFCQDESEVEALTGFKTRGMFITAFDEVITSYNTHYHEVAHLLINYKLQNLGLYTLPFFLEGFAVAVGGRGGMSSRVITDIGSFLQQAGFLIYSSIINNDSFYNNDASMAYAVSGLYNLFLINEVGTNNYLNLYKKVNGSLDYIRNISSKQIDLPDESRFLKFLSEDYKKKHNLFLNLVESYVYQPVIASPSYEDNGDYYYFMVDNNFNSLYSLKDTVASDYKSRLCESVTKKIYAGEKYLITVDTTHIKLYNCYNNELLASYDMNFSPEHRKISFALRYSTIDIYPFTRVLSAKYYVFFVRKSVFDSDTDFGGAYKINAGNEK